MLEELFKEILELISCVALLILELETVVLLEEILELDELESDSFVLELVVSELLKAVLEGLLMTDEALEALLMAELEEIITELSCAEDKLSAEEINWLEELLPVLELWLITGSEELSKEELFGIKLDKLPFVETSLCA